MNPVVMLILGVILVIVARYFSPHLPSPLPELLQAVGWILIVVGLLLFFLALLGISLGVGALR